MKKLQSISFHLHWITLCCFLFPFFFDSCSTKKTDEAIEDSTSVVSPINTPLHFEDSISNEHTQLDTADTAITDSTAETQTSDKDELLSETIIKKYPILKPILIPDAGIHTGLGTIVNSIQFLAFFATTITFLLLLIGLLLKLIDKHALKTFLIIEICAAAFLFIASPYMIFRYEILWGYWLCLFCISTLTIIDAFVVYKQKREEI